MKAVICHHNALTLDDVELPAPGPGQLLVDVRRCGICGSDLHARHSGDELADVLGEIGYDDFMRSSERVVLGHEFYGEIAEHGPRTRKKLPAGTPVVAMPLVRSNGAVHPIGLTARAPGGYAEQILTQESLTLRVPNGLAPDIATLTEPMAVAWHAVNRGELGKRDSAVVIGCGPVGLAIILLLKARGVRTVIASDLSPGRRALADSCGADLVVDPREVSPYDVPGAKHLRTAPDALNAATDAIDQLTRLPFGWWHSWRALDKVGVTRPKAPVIFECVGVPGMLDQILTGAPLYSRVVVVGVCMGADRIRPSLGINKEIDLRFVIGYTPLEFRDTLHALAEGDVDPSPLLTGRVGLGGVAGAFEALGDPEAHAKIVVDPALAGEEIAPV